MPVAVYDDLNGTSMDASTLNGAEFSLEALEAITVLHQRGYLATEPLGGRLRLRRPVP